LRRGKIRWRFAAALAAGATLFLLSACGSDPPGLGGIGAAAGPVVAGISPTTTSESGFHTTTSSTPVFAREIIGRSLKGRAIEMFTAGEGPRRVIVLGDIHGDETGEEVARALLDYLKGHPEALPQDAVLAIIPVANPDGDAAGTRGNANGVDLNRNFPSRNWSADLAGGDGPAQGLTGGEAAGSEPETKALLNCLAEGCDLVISLHSYGGLIDFDGPGGEEVAQGMSGICGLPVRHMVYQQHVTGSLGIFVPERYGVPVITVELDGPDLSPGLRKALLLAIGLSLR
jgi:predicted deacylase